MSSEYQFMFPLGNGLHARPASHLQAIANRFRSEVILRVRPANARTDRSANAKSVLSMVSLDVQKGDACALVVSGDDEPKAIAELGQFVREVLPGVDDVQVAAPTQVSDLKLPRSLKATGLTRFYRGKTVSGGMGRGVTVISGSRPLEVSEAGKKSAGPQKERARLEAAIAKLGAEMTSRIEKVNGSVARSQEREIAEAHRSILRDVELFGRALELIQTQGVSAGVAVVAVAEHFSSILSTTRSEYLRERAIDVRDVCGQLLETLGERADESRLQLTKPTVLISENLTPSELLGLDRKLLKGLVLRHGGSTSHTVILARSMGIPTVVGVEEAPGGFSAERLAIVDGGLGIVVPEVSDSVSRYYDLEELKYEKARAAAASRGAGLAATRDGHLVEVGCNIASAHEVHSGVENGADGVGLFRTEMLFVDRASAPTEDEQFASYEKAAKDSGGRPVIVRLVDIGGDKEVEYLGLPKEENPFLGFRGVRIYAEQHVIVRTQIRAILRAGAASKSTDGKSTNLKMMVPMISSVDELRMVRSLVTTAKAELEAEGKRCVVPQIGVMIEVPSAVMMVPELAREADFFSIGSNDLAQYCMAADRGNARVASIGTWSQPGFLRLLKAVVDGARVAEQSGAARPWIGLCGEMGDSVEALPLLVGLGLDEISVSIPRVSAIKQAIKSLTMSDCESVLAAALKCATRDEVETLLRAPERSTAKLPMLADELLVLDSDARSKEEVIKQLCDALGVGGWTDQPVQVEEAIWLREETYSTGFGHGFAVPHCKSEFMRAHAIAVARLNKPVSWGSIDGEPVDVVFLLAIRSLGQERAHMRVFSLLSRLVMRSEFRDQVRAERNPAALRAFLEAKLELVNTDVSTSQESGR